MGRVVAVVGQADAAEMHSGQVYVVVQTVGLSEGTEVVLERLPDFEREGE